MSEADVERLAAALGLPLEPGSAAAVAQNVAGLLAYAELFVEFPLPDDVEPPPVARPRSSRSVALERERRVPGNLEAAGES